MVATFWSNKKVEPWKPWPATWGYFFRKTLFIAATGDTFMRPRDLIMLPMWTGLKTIKVQVSCRNSFSIFCGLGEGVEPRDSGQLPGAPARKLAGRPGGLGPVWGRGLAPCRPRTYLQGTARATSSGATFATYFVHPSITPKRRY